jgi:hypothetical protein
MVTTFLKVANNAAGTLLNTINAGASSLTLAAGEGSKFPSTFPFPITIDGEILNVGARADDVLSSLTRGEEGTGAAEHTAGAAVRLNITAEQISDIHDAVNALEATVIFADGSRAFTGPPDAGNNVINNVANPVLGGDAVNLNTLLDSMTIALHYHFLASNVMSSVFSAGEAFEDELITGTPQELTTIFQVSTAADTPAPFAIDAGALISVHFDAAVLQVAGKKPTFVYVQLGYVDADGSSNFVQIGADSDPTTTRLTEAQEEVELHIHVAAETNVPATKRLMVKWWATTTGALPDPTIHIYYGALADHITIPISASILGNYLPLAGGTMTGPITGAFSEHTYPFVPDAAQGEDIIVGDQQGILHHSGDQEETVTAVYLDSETAPTGASLIIELEYGDTDDLDTVGAWTRIDLVTLTATNKSVKDSSPTQATLPANRLIRLNVDQVGSTLTGADAAVHMKVLRKLAS